MHLHAPLKGDGEGHGADGHHLRQDFFADDAVAARGRAHELPVFIGEVDGQTIELMLDDVFHRFPGQLVRAGRPVYKRRFALRLVQAPQPCQMRVLLKVGKRLCTHAPGGGVGQALAGFFLHAAQLVVHAVPLGVGNGRLAQRIILVSRFVEAVYQRAHIHRKSLRYCSDYLPTLTIGAALAANSFSCPSAKRTRTRWPSPLPVTSVTTPRLNTRCITSSPT